MITVSKLLETARRAYRERWRYWNSTFGQVATKDLLNRKRAQRPAEFPHSRDAQLNADIANRAIVCDCCGLIKAALWNRPESNTYIAAQDRNADMMFEDAKKAGRPWGKISTMPDRAGICLYKKGHIGIYDGNGFDIQEKGFDSGCVRLSVPLTKWTHWFEHVDVVYSTEDEERHEVKCPYSEPFKNIKKGMTGNDVMWVQWHIGMCGYQDRNVEGVDGIFGKGTDWDVRAFQRAYGLEEDGIVGILTRRKLKEVLYYAN